MHESDKAMNEVSNVFNVCHRFNRIKVASARTQELIEKMINFLHVLQDSLIFLLQIVIFFIHEAMMINNDSDVILEMTKIARFKI